MIRQLLHSERTPLKLSIVPGSGERPGEGNQVDYVPFGVKTVKVEVSGDYEGKAKLCLAPRRFRGEKGKTFSHEDDGDSPQFVVMWGGGHEDCYPLDYPNKRFVYFLLWHTGDDLDNCTLTIEARPEGSDEGKECRIELTYPTFSGTGQPWPPPDELVRPRWVPVKRGLDGASDIILDGQRAPNYVSRWWPRRKVIYGQYAPSPPRVRLRYKRLVKDDGGEVMIYAMDPQYGREVHLATIQGSIPHPLYDMRQVVPELYRFGPRTWVVRVWFFWLAKEISQADLRLNRGLSPEELDQSWRSIMPEPEGLAAESWDERHEIPDAERVDIVLLHDPETGRLQPLFGATDLHWHELWARFRSPHEPVSVRIVNARLKERLPEWHEARGLINELTTVLTKKLLPEANMSPPYDPHLEVKEDLAKKGKLGPLDTIRKQTHTPTFLNVEVRGHFASTDVRDG